MTVKQAVPKGLRTPGAALWRGIAGQWAADRLIPDAREVRLLTDASREADVLALLESELDAAAEAGTLIVRGSTGQPVTHPHVAEARRSRAQIAAHLGKLGFADPAAAKTANLGGMTTAEAGRRGALRRHHGSTSGIGG